MDSYEKGCVPWIKREEECRHLPLEEGEKTYCLFVGDTAVMFTCKPADLLEFATEVAAIAKQDCSPPSEGG